MFKKPNSKVADNRAEQAPEKLRYSTYYEQDGMLRAYANRAMLLAMICAPTALVSMGIVIFLLMRPTPVVRVDARGVATMVDSHGTTAVAEGSGATPDEIEKRAVVRAFLAKYENFSAESVSRQWADAVNMMTSNLRRATLSQMQTENTIGNIKEQEVTSVFQLKSIEDDKADPLSFVAFGVKDIHRVHDHQESSDRLVLQFHIQLVPERRSEKNASGLLVSRYTEDLIEGEKRDQIIAASTLGDAK